MTKGKKEMEGESSFIPLVGLPVFEKHYDDFSSLDTQQGFGCIYLWDLGDFHTELH